MGGKNRQRRRTAAPFFLGNSNIVGNGSNFAAASANTSTYINNGSGNKLQVDQAFSFVANNAMAIDVKLTNVSGAAGAVSYRRIGDWDIAPTQFRETISANARSGNVTDSTYQGFQDANPLTALGSKFPAGGGTFGPNGLGAGLDLDFGTLANGGSANFRLLYAIRTPGQTEAQLRAQLAALGAFSIISGRDSSTPGGVNFFALGVVATPEPASLTVFGAVAVGGVVTLLRRRKTAVA